ncbi:unnamed protein product [Gordionus sp. m RMFG-2023]|uniref:galactoside alpha-(1,2)-fucosyltransferase 2-like n=1 Tax=Gordionus sp. m RMFG-2023 TaxID=3053472 RepID=UPI0030E3DEFE
MDKLWLIFLICLVLFFYSFSNYRSRLWIPTRLNISLDKSEDSKAELLNTYLLGSSSVHNSNILSKNKSSSYTQYAESQSMVPVANDVVEDINKTIIICSINNRYIGWEALGRLGNMMFQYAAIYSLAKDTGKIPTLLVSTEYLEGAKMSDYFKLSYREMPELPMNCYSRASALIGSNGSLEKRFDLLAYNTLLIDKVKNDGYNVFEGYPNSYKYFEKYKEEIRREFTFRKKIKSKADRFLGKIKASYFESINRHAESKNRQLIFVSIHIRRTDMIRWMVYNQGTISGLAYIKKAMNWFKGYFTNLNVYLNDNRSNKSLNYHFAFIACSDDLEWSRENLGNIDNIYFCPGISPIDDLAILASCNHTILTQGTYGWWGAYLRGDLGDGSITIYPSNFLANTSIQFIKKNFTYANYYPQNWIGLPI